MRVLAGISLVLLAVGALIAGLARGVDVKDAGKLLATIGGVCLVLSGLGWVFG